MQPKVRVVFFFFAIARIRCGESEVRRESICIVTARSFRKNRVQNHGCRKFAREISVVCAKFCSSIPRPKRRRRKANRNLRAQLFIVNSKKTEKPYGGDKNGMLARALTRPNGPLPSLEFLGEKCRRWKLRAIRFAHDESTARGLARHRSRAASFAPRTD